MLKFKNVGVIFFLAITLSGQIICAKAAPFISGQFGQNFIDGKSVESIWSITFFKPASPTNRLTDLELTVPLKILRNNYNAAPPASTASIQSFQNQTNDESFKLIRTIALGQQVNLGFPIRLKIPKINVDTALEHVGLTSQGAVDVPKDPANVAWYDLGPRPGQNGSAVITGHYGWWKDGRVGVFNNLSKLKKGDKVYVQDEKGVTTTFVVQEFRSYDQNADAWDVFGSSDGKSHLNLITCEGVWNEVFKSYTKRLVVFTDKE
ncbi:MAG: class F sortase [Patescibacteria group bacterium]